MDFCGLSGLGGLLYIGNMAFRGEDLGSLKLNNVYRGIQIKANAIVTHNIFTMT